MLSSACLAGAPRAEARGQGVENALLYRRLFAGTIKPDKRRLFAEPDQLPTRVAAVVLDNQVTGLRLAADATEHPHHLPVHEPAERPRVRRHSAREQPLDLGDDAASELLVDATGDALRRQCRGQLQSNADDFAVSD